MNAFRIDPAEAPEASYFDNPIDHIEPEPEEFTLRQKVVAWLVNEVYPSPDRDLSIEAMAIACGWSQAQGVSQTDAAKRLGITRAAMSKHVNRWREKLGLNYSPGFRTDLSRKKGTLNNHRWLPNDEKQRA